MKIKSLSLISLVAALAGTTSANAGMIADFYAGAVLGAGGQTIFVDDKHESDSAMSFGAVVGLDIPLFRVEGEYSYLNSADTHGNVAMVNAYFKMPATLIMPYIGAGAGLLFSGEHEYTEAGVKTSIDFDTTIAYQGMLGLTLDLPIFPVKFDLEGRALYAPNVVEIENEKPDFLDYNVRLKARYIF